MRPRDVRGFAERLAATGASSFATQPLYPVRGEFMSGSTSVALAKAREDGWTDERVAAGQEELGAALKWRLAVRWKPG